VEPLLLWIGFWQAREGRLFRLRPLLRFQGGAGRFTKVLNIIYSPLFFVLSLGDFHVPTRLFYCFFEPFITWAMLWRQIATSVRLKYDCSLLDWKNSPARETVILLPRFH